MSVLLLPPIFQFFDNNGDPLANGFVYTYAAGTTTPLATYTSDTGLVAAPNPIELNAAGRPTSGSGAIWGEGAYKFIVKDSNGVQVGDALDNVTSFTTLASATSAYFESFSGNGSQTVFATSDDLGTEEKALMVFVSKGLQEIVTNGNFTSDTDWTKGAGWTISAGVATAAGAISTAISQVPTISLLVGQAYAVTYTITRSAGGVIPSLGGQAGTERTASGTYREVIIAAATTPIAFTGNAFTGTLDSVSITRADSQGYDILPPSAYTISGTSLTFASAPATGTNNIYVFAPSLLLGAASSAAALAELYAANALASQISAAISASSASAYAAAKNQWTFSTTTAMADPSTANLRLNNATLSSVTQIAISDLSANAGNPDLGAWIDTWDDSAGLNRGSIYIFKDNSNFVIYNVNAALTDNTSWHQIPVTYIASSGSFSASDSILIGFTAAGATTVTGGITSLTGDVTASGTGSVPATIASLAVTTAKIANDAVTLAKIQNATANSRLIGSGASGSGADYAELTLGSGLAITGTSVDIASRTETTFTPTVFGSTTAGVTTYTTQSGIYKRIGNIVYFSIYLLWTNATGTGNMRVGGLPVTSAAFVGGYHVNVYQSNLNVGAGLWLTAQVPTASTNIILYSCNPTGAGAEVAIDINAELIITGFYFV